MRDPALRRADVFVAGRLSPLIVLALACACGFEAPQPLDSLATPAPVAAAPTAGLPLAIDTPTPTATPRPSPSPAPDLIVELDEATLTEQLNAELAGNWQVETAVGPATVQSLEARFRDGRVELSGTAQAGYLVSLPLLVTTGVEARDGRPVVRVEQATVGGVPLPESGRREIETRLQSTLDRAIAGDRVRVQSIVVEQGTLRARVRPG